MKRKRLIFVTLAFSLILTGCWSQKELTDLAIISVLGMDLAEDGRLIGTLQIINPGNVAGGMQGGGGTQGPPVTVYTSTGDSVTEFSRRASRKISRTLYYAHTNLVVISEELAKRQDISIILDAIERDAEFRNTANVVIARGAKASDLVKVLTPIDKIPANKVIKTLQFSEQQWGEFMSINVQDTIKDLASSGKEPIITGFILEGDAEEGKKLEGTQATEPVTTLGAAGLATFRNGKLSGWVDGEKARGTIWILDKIKQTAIGVDYMGQKQSVIYQVIRQKTKVSGTIQKGKPKITINIDAEGDIGETKVPLNLNDPKVLLSLEKKLNKEIKKEIKMAVNNAQKNKTDIFGFGQAIHRSYPKEWKKLQKDWDEAHFADMEVDVKVGTYIRRTGLRNNPHFK
ncbi:Ger(x)C family spore germination protein [Mesobacillus foraminis]|uniref:Ger(x)C family spore germination protein n=1 Tax=Mesobacillus foraminis TaxID=279826 RepID=UPI001BEBE185|nr:Ger(x)C family spore germination protein [Mesobacillus foraminis]MBT2759224.1 Ger(x)C family spore germination protein [Mesobacillus foraminis]